MNDWLLRNLVCPHDKDPLQLNGDQLTCRGGHCYSIVDGIPVMIFDEEHPTHDYLRQSLDQVARINAGEPIESVLREIDKDSEVDGFVQGEVPYTSGILYFSIQHKLKRYPLPNLRPARL